MNLQVALGLRGVHAGKASKLEASITSAARMMRNSTACHQQRPWTVTGGMVTV